MDYNFNYCLIDIKTPYLIENHLICIKYDNKTNVDDEETNRNTIKDKYIVNFC